MNCSGLFALIYILRSVKEMGGFHASVSFADFAPRKKITSLFLYPAICRTSLSYVGPICCSQTRIDVGILALHYTSTLETLPR